MVGETRLLTGQKYDHCFHIIQERITASFYKQADSNTKMLIKTKLLKQIIVILTLSCLRSVSRLARVIGPLIQWFYTVNGEACSQRELTIRKFVSIYHF